MKTDYDPIVLSEFDYKGRLFKFKEPIEFFPINDEFGEYIVVKNKDYCLYCYSFNIDDLIIELKEEFSMLWDMYACNNNYNLAPKAKKLKTLLLDNLMVTNNEF